MNALIITFIKPGTDLADVDRSLEIVRKDVALRIQQGGLRTPRRKTRRDGKVASYAKEKRTGAASAPISEIYAGLPQPGHGLFARVSLTLGHWWNSRKPLLC